MYEYTMESYAYLLFPTMLCIAAVLLLVYERTNKQQRHVMSNESRHWWNEEYVVFIATDLRKLNAELRSADENYTWYPGYLTRTPWAGPEANEFAAVDFEDLPHMAKVVMVSSLDGYDATIMDEYAEEFHQVTKLFYNATKRQVTR